MVKITYSKRIHVLEIKIDAPLKDFNFVQVSLGYSLDVNSPIGTRVQAPIYKHMLHIYIPKEQWKSQYKLWDSYEAVINDDGSVKLEKISEGDNR